jgi:mannose-6-phosphate isomerase
VHPNDEYAARVENDRGKTEMWYIVEADEGAQIICGLQDGVDGKMLADAVAQNRVEDVLCHIPVHAGECYFIPAGLPHAIGKGILIAEIQQNCDLTYRVYDYNRRDKNGNTRELHVKKALDVIRPFSAQEIERIRYSRTGDVRDGLLADCEYFRVERIVSSGEARLNRSARMGHLLCISGEGVLYSDGLAYDVHRGDGYLIPAACSEVRFCGKATLIYTEAY